MYDNRKSITSIMTSTAKTKTDTHIYPVFHTNKQIILKYFLLIN